MARVSVVSNYLACKLFFKICLMAIEFPVVSNYLACKFLKNSTLYITHVL
jgi:hypothetical protein